ncbi:MAG: hypothetical protein PHY14_04380 [Candidatus Gracilibacteria bacterium]|nr:hypothetical protein [Candidatus Gracilibacteria bacterium]
MFRGIFHILKSIFVDENDRVEPVIQVKVITEHYKKDLGKCFLDEIWIASEYKKTKNVIEQYKYQSDRDISDVLVQYYLQIFEQNRQYFSEEEHWCIVPAPMHWSRYLIRGFDHMNFLAQRLSEEMHVPYKNILQTSYRPRQSKLKRTSRLANKTNAFRIRNGFSEIPENIIFIDDVISSGSTANHCAEVLKKEGAHRIIGWFIASNN